MKLEGLVVFISGGASGLGEAAARFFVKQGCKVAVADVDKQRGERL